MGIDVEGIREQSVNGSRAKLPWWQADPVHHDQADVDTFGAIVCVGGRPSIDIGEPVAIVGEPY